MADLQERSCGAHANLLLREPVGSMPEIVMTCFIRHDSAR